MGGGSFRLKIRLMTSLFVFLLIAPLSLLADDDNSESWDKSKEKEYQHFKKMIDDSNIDMDTAYEFAKRYKEEREGESQQKQDKREQRALDAQQKKDKQQQSGR